MRKTIFWHVLVCFSILPSALASVGHLTYQGRIVKDNGQPFTHGSVSFLFEIVSSNGLCTLYREQKSGVNMLNSGGLFDLAIGGGTRLFPQTAIFKLEDVFKNSSSLNCADGDNSVAGSWSPSFDSTRKLRVQFHDGAGWRLITPDNEIRSVPYAHHASSALKLDNYSATDFVRVSQMPVAACSPGQVITFDGTRFVCASSESGSGQVTEIEAGSGIVVSGTTTKNVSVSFGTTAGTAAQGNDSRIEGAFQQGTSLSGDLSGTLPSPTVVQIRGRPVANVAPENNQVLKWNGSAWAPANESDFSFTSEAANLVLAAPSGGSGIPTFRALNISDIFSSVGGMSFLNSSVACSAGRALVYVSASDRIQCSDVSINWSAVAGKPTTLAEYGITDAGSVTSIVAGTGLTGGTITSQGTLAVDVGVTANKVVQLDASAALPAVSGESLNNINANSLASGVVDVARLPAAVKYWESATGGIHYSQGRVGIGSASPQGALDVNSTTGAFIPPRMSEAQRDSLVSVPDGAVIYNVTAGKMNFLESGVWKEIGISGAGSSGAIDVQEFLADGSWTKPSSGTLVRVECWGGGGAGGRSATYSGGGGGGAYVTRKFHISELTPSVAITIGVGGTGRNTNGNGNSGGHTIFGSYLTAFGGSGGLGSGCGGGGGGLASAASGATGGFPEGGDSCTFTSVYSEYCNDGETQSCYRGLFNGAVIPAKTTLHGGAAGGFVSTVGTPNFMGNYSYAGGKAGDSIYGGAGGGACRSTSVHAAGTSVHGGNGGAPLCNGGIATSGAVPGGGGGASRNGTSGAGGNGMCRVTTW